MRSRARGRRLDVLDRVYFPHSLGLLYLAITQYLGFPKYGDEYKVMGLAPYGKPDYVERASAAGSTRSGTAASRSTSPTSGTGPRASA